MLIAHSRRRSIDQYGYPDLRDTEALDANQALFKRTKDFKLLVANDDWDFDVEEAEYSDLEPKILMVGQSSYSFPALKLAFTCSQRRTIN